MPRMRANKAGFEIIIGKYKLQGTVPYTVLSFFRIRATAMNAKLAVT